MRYFRPYLPILWTLALNLVKLLSRVGRQIVLPGRKKAGNLLTSLFLLFEGLVEELIGCRRAVIAVPLNFAVKIPAKDKLVSAWGVGKDWLRRGMLVAAWALFILTSFEWAGEAVRGSNGGAVRGSGVEHAAQTVSLAAVAEEVTPLEKAPLALRPAVPFTTIDRSFEPWAKRWLLLRSLRL